MSDYALIEAMALAMLKSGYSSFWSADDLKGMAHHALAVCRPIIERETRERCARIAEGLNGWGDDCGAGGHAMHIASVIRETDK